MADRALHGNGEACPACALRREDEDLSVVLRPEVACNLCGGMGRIAIPDHEIVRRHVEEARRLYWPAFWARAAAGSKV